MKDHERIRSAIPALKKLADDVYKHANKHDYLYDIVDMIDDCIEILEEAEEKCWRKGL